MTTTEKLLRRNLVEAIIKLASTNVGGGIQLVSVKEWDRETAILFEREHPVRTVPDSEGRWLETSQFTVTVTQDVVPGER